MNLEDAIEHKPSNRKRLVVASLLALAAVGTHWLPSRMIVPMASAEPQKSMAATSDTVVAGANSLLGDTVADRTSQALVSGADLSHYHLDVDSVVDQGGLSRLLNGIAPLSGEMAVVGGGESAGQANAVPEPKAAGLFLLAAAPALIRRKGRIASEAR